MIYLNLHLHIPVCLYLYYEKGNIIVYEQEIFKDFYPLIFHITSVTLLDINLFDNKLLDLSISPIKIFLKIDNINVNKRER